MQITDLKGQKVGIAVSGGLDSCTTTRFMRDNGVEPYCFTVNLGQTDEPDLEVVRQRMLASGAVEAFILDGSAMIARAGILIIQAQARYEGEYWNTTGGARYVTTALIIREMQKQGINIFSHGATGRGNDQVRFQLAANMIDPSIEVYAPWRDDSFLKQFGGRKEMIDFCLAKGIPIRHSHTKPYSTDANALGLTHEAGDLESLLTEAYFVTPEMGVLPMDAPDEAELFSVDFVNGIPRAINDVPYDLIDTFIMANAIGGRNAVGICRHVVESRFVGIKSRGVYEQPGMEVLGQCYEYLLQLILDRRARDYFDFLSRYIGKQIYQGYWLDTGSRLAMSSVMDIAKLATGRITVKLYKGMVSFVSAENVDCSLYSEADASMESIGSFNHADSEGFLRILGVSAKNLSLAQQTHCQDFLVIK
jgi:argininosuccinate synthase